MASTSDRRALTQREIFYFRQRLKNRLYQSVIALFADKAEKEGLTKRDLAISLGKDPAQITRLLAGPGNWTLDTVSDLLLAMDSELEQRVEPLSLDSPSPKVFWAWGQSPQKVGNDNQTNCDWQLVKVG